MPVRSNGEVRVPGSAQRMVGSGARLSHPGPHEDPNAAPTRQSRRLGRRLQGFSLVFGSDDPDVLGFFALAAGTHVELDGLALIEGAVAVPLDVGVVHEDVVAAVS